MSIKPFAFVLMPFSNEFDDIYKFGIQAAAVECEVVAERVDEQIYSETMLERIYRQIDAADFIIADLTGKNPNVFYEIGYAHAKGKPCTLLTQRADDIPFDLKHHRCLVYDGKIQKLKDLLNTEIQWQKAELEKRRSTTFNVSLARLSADLSKTKYSATAEVAFKIDIHNHTQRRTPDIEVIYLHTGKGWSFTQNGEPCAHSDSSIKGKQIRHFIKPPVPRLSPGGWAQLAVDAKKVVWTEWGQESEEPKEKYPIKGVLTVEIVSSEGNFFERLNVDIEAEEFPF
jgi:nucleoside 2-deoxyribosyltransferase